MAALLECQVKLESKLKACEEILLWPLVISWQLFPPLIEILSSNFSYESSHLKHRLHLCIFLPHCVLGQWRMNEVHESNLWILSIKWTDVPILFHLYPLKCKQSPTVVCALWQQDVRNWTAIAHQASFLSTYIKGLSIASETHFSYNCVYSLSLQTNLKQLNLSANRYE